MGTVGQIFWLIATACSTRVPVDFGGCSSLTDASDRANCRFEFAQVLLVEDRDELSEVIASMPDEGERDLLRLRLAITQPKLARRFCQDVETNGAQERCRQVLGRPHLQTSRKPPQDPP